MRTFRFVICSWNARHLFVCLTLFTAMGLLSVTAIRPASADGSIDDSVRVPDATFPGTGVGPIPDSPGGAPPSYGAPRVVSFAVSGVVAPITDISVNVTLTHTWCGDIDMVLAAPGGSPNLVTVGHIGVTFTGSPGSDRDYNGTYNFTDSATGTNIWTAAITNPIPPGNYRTTVRGMAGTTNPPPTTSLNSTFGGLTTGQANGIWTLTIRDGFAGETGNVTAATLTITTGGPVAQKAPLDFDGDGKTDYAVVRNFGGILTWYIQRSALGFVGQTFGDATDRLVPADYDGDFKWDIAVWRSGTFYILKSSTGALQVISFGAAGDEAYITQDFDGDGRADPAVLRNVGGALTWYIQRSALGFKAETFGNAPSDVGVRGDFDGDRRADIAVYRPTGSPANTFFIHRSSDGGVQAATFGTFSTDYILPADFDGDGKTDYAVWRGVGPGTSGTWYWLQSSDGGFRALNFGIGGNFGVGDQAVPGDYDGDGRTDQAVWRPGPPSTFYVNRSSLGFVGFGFGVSTDVPPANALQVR